MLSRIGMQIDDAISQYNTIGNGVFARPRKLSGRGILRPKYRSKDMETAVKKVLEEGLTRESKRTHTNAVNIKLRNENAEACHT
jgi:hypothetical protein